MSDRPPRFASESEPRRRAPGRFRRAMRTVGVVVATGATFVVAVGGGALLHLGTKPARRVVATQVTALLEEPLKGKIAIDGIGALGLGGIGGVTVHVLDPSGREVLVAHGVRARLSLLGVAQSALLGKGDMIIRVNEVSIDHVDVLLLPDADGVPSLAHAFEPKPDDKPTDPNSRGVDLQLPKIELRHAWVHGTMPGVPFVDAEVNGLDASVRSAPQATTLDVAKVGLVARALVPRPITADVEAHVTLPGKPEEAMKARGRVDGAVGDVVVHAQASLDGKRVDGVVDIPRTEPAAIRAILPEIGIGEAASAHVAVAGTLPTLKVDGDVHLGRGRLVVDGTVKAEEETRVDARLSATGIDVRAISPDAPPSNLNLETNVSVVAKPSGAVGGTFDARTTPATIAGQVVPAVEAKGQFVGAAVRGEATIHEVGAPTRVKFDLREETKGQNVVDFETTSHVANLAAIPRIGPVAKGSVRVRTKGRVDLAASRIDARVDADLAHVEASGVRLREAAATARLNGPFAALAIDARVQGSDLEQGDMRFAKVDARAKGRLDELEVGAALEGSDSAPSVSARASLKTGDVTVVRNASAEVTRGDVTMRARVDMIRSAGSALDVRGVVVEGLGDTLYANVHLDPGDVAIEARSTKVDLKRVATLAGVSNELKDGTVALDAFFGMHHRMPYGEVSVGVGGLVVEGFRPAHAQIDAVLDGNKLEGTADVELDEVGWAKVESKVALVGAVTDVKTWRNALGSMSLDSRSSLTQLAALLPPDKLPVESVAGELSIRGKVLRETREDIPDVHLMASTHGLKVVGAASEMKNADGTITRTAPGFRSEGVDIGVNAAVDGASGFSELTTVLQDARGPLAYLNAKADVPLSTIVSDPSQAPAILEKLHFTSHLEVPRRSLDALPSAVGPVPMRGEVAMGMDVSGTLKAPIVDVGIRAFGLQAGNAPRSSMPLDMTARATYDATHANARVMVIRRDRTVVDAYAAATAPLEAIMNRPEGAPIPWSAGARVKIDRFALEDIAWMLHQRMSGAVSGSIALDHLHEKPVLDARLDLQKVNIGAAELPQGTVTFAADTSAARASVQLAQKDGHARAGLAAPLTWEDGVVPALDATRAIDLNYDFARFRLAAIAPFVRDSLPTLDGRLDGKGTVRIEPNRNDSKATGHLALSEGKFHVAALGDEFHGVKAKIRMDPWGTVRVEDVEASGVTGRVKASAWAKLEGVELRHAEASVRIQKGEALPLSLEGVPLGQAWGAIDVKADSKSAKEGINVAVNIPVFQFELPQAPGRSIQELEPDETVRIGMVTSRGFVELPIEKPQAKPDDETEAKQASTPIRIEVNLGEDVTVTRGTMMNIALTGKPIIELNDVVRTSGEIRLTRGFIELQGKRFQVERALVTLNDEDPSNPTITATAYYDAPDRTRVFADFVGPVKTGKLTLRSDPPHTKDEILAVLLFGSAEGAVGAASSPRRNQGGQQATKAVALGGGFVTEGLNKVLSGVSPYEITTRVATNESNNPRPEVAVQVAKTVSARVAYNLGIMAPGQNPDRALLMLDWRFRRRWSMLTTVGNRGSSIVDFIWHYSY